MATSERDDDGFGLVEMIIAMLLLAIIAVALIPPLWNSILLSSTQSASATATRELNALIEEGRDVHTCAKLTQITTTTTYYTGTPREFVVRVPIGITYACTPKTAVPVTLEAVRDGEVLATVQAKIFVP
ncbi:type II secretion system protein [Microbacterium sp. NPDC089321]|uniref:type IV pilus modification PilV family protein n=1 Tax=Microbacterium sp. NPDC089321 TaxID=3155183 RepID=UPI0034395AB3